ncbi:MAG: thioredoxin family protein [bacterium]
MAIKSIQVLGSGCPTCKQLLALTQKAAEELRINTKVEYITDVAKMIGLGVMTSPALIINGQIVLTGSGKSQEAVKKALQANLK